MITEVIGIIVVGGTDYPVSAQLTLPDDIPAPKRSLFDRITGKRE